MPVIISSAYLPAILKDGLVTRQSVLPVRLFSGYEKGLHCYTAPLHL